MKQLFSNESRHAIVGFITWIGASRPRSQTSIMLKWFDSFSKRMDRLTKEKGLKYTVGYVKRMQLHLTRFLSGSPLYVNDIMLGLYKTGIPKDLCKGYPTLKFRILDKDPVVIRSYMTVFNVVRLHLGDGALDSSTVESPSTSEESLEDDIIDCVAGSRWGIRLRGFLQKEIATHKWRMVHLTTKKGPNGQAIGTALKDLIILPEWLLDNIYILGGENLEDYIKTLRSVYIRFEQWVNDNVSRSSFLRRISVKPDKALKNRPIAILDYWSQSALRPLHEALFSLLSNIPEDMTFDQLGITRFIGSWESYHSLDLSSATDRFPISLQEKILGYMIDESYASAWHNVMVKLPFENKGKYYTYNAGQPMGAYSSWAMFALSHHVIVQYSAFKTGQASGGKFGEFGEYALLGDDIVIGNRIVAEHYKRTMKSLGVDLSEAKSHESTRFVEFAKNSWYIDDENNVINVSGVPLNGILTAKSVPYELALELRRLINRGTLRKPNVTVSTDLIEFVSHLYAIPLELNRKKVLKLYMHLTDWFRTIDAYEWVKSYCNNTLSPTQRHCNHSPEDTYKFYTSVLLDDVKEFIKRTQKDLINNIVKSKARISSLQDEMTKYCFRELGREDLPDLSVLEYQPWNMAIEDQIDRAREIEEELLKFDTQLREDAKWEEIVTKVASLRISDPETIDSRRMSDIVLKTKRRLVARLLMWEKSH